MVLAGGLLVLDRLAFGVPHPPRYAGPAAGSSSYCILTRFGFANRPQLQFPIKGARQRLHVAALLVVIADLTADRLVLPAQAQCRTGCT